MRCSNRPKRPLRWLLALSFLGLSFMSYSAIFESAPDVSGHRPASSIHINGRFQNMEASQEIGLMDGLKAMVRNITDKSPNAIPSHPLEVAALTREDLDKAPNQSFWRLGHSTLLFNLNGKFLLTDPVFAERASPFSFAGPKRFHSAPIALDDLPALEAVIISHDHYDHLDHDTILALQEKVRLFVTPLGVGDRLIAWGVPVEKIRQVDWWQATDIDTLRIVATPAQHFSGRSLTDNNRTLWASWVLMTSETRIFFSGDSGYFRGFKEIGERFGPFDVTLLENGAYNEAWADIHMRPEQTLLAHLDLRGKVLVPIHNGTFDMALHAWTEPLEQIESLAAQEGVVLRTPRFGERLDILHPARTYAWWRNEGEKSRSLLSGNSRVAPEAM